MRKSAKNLKTNFRPNCADLIISREIENMEYIITAFVIMITLGLLWLLSEKDRLMETYIIRKRIKYSKCLLRGASLHCNTELSPHPAIKVPAELPWSVRSRLPSQNIDKFYLCSDCAEFIIDSLIPRNKNYLEMTMDENTGWNYHFKDKIKREQNNKTP